MGHCERLMMILQPPQPTADTEFISVHSRSLIPQDSEVDQALLALAQTCRAVSEPSLNRLWQRLGFLQLIIRCVAPAINSDTMGVRRLCKLALADEHDKCQ